MSDCISHSGLYDNWDNPLTDDGQPYLPGIRKCGHRDCVNIWHIEGLEQQALFMSEAKRKPRQKVASAKRIGSKALAHKARVELAKANQQVIYAKVVELGNSPQVEGATVCQLPFCERPYKARNLCPNHWQMFRRQSPESLKRIRRFSGKDFENVPKPVFRRKAVEWPTSCVLDGCARPVRSRSLCKIHYRAFLRTKSKGELIADRPQYSLADFAHVPTDYNHTNKKVEGKCSLDDCAEPQNVKTLCENHYRTYRRLTKAAEKAEQ